MSPLRSISLPRVVSFLTGLLIFKIAGSVWLSYGDYFPPNFDNIFLRGREATFFGSYQWAFYTHIVIGPLTLLLGWVLLSQKFRQRWPLWHRRLGRLQALAVLCLLAPSGLWMAWWAEAGPVAAVGFATLAILTGSFVALGWRAAVHRRFETHRRWMTRCYLLLSSAVVIRMIGGLATFFELTFAWIDPLAAWISWLAPLACYEVWRRRKWFGRKLPIHAASPALDASAALSPNLP